MDSEWTENSSLLHRPLRWGESVWIPEQNWRLSAAEGLLCIGFGSLALFLPGITLAIATYLFAITAISLGIGEVVDSIRGSLDGDESSSEVVLEPWRRWLLFLLGLLHLFIGIGSLMWPGVTANFILNVVAAWAVLIGCTEVLIGCNARDSIGWGNIINGFVMVILGAFLYAVSPAEGILALIWAFGVLGLIGGFFLLLSAVWTRRRELQELNSSSQSIQSEESEGIDRLSQRDQSAVRNIDV
uniref:HdeD family acid-resistance protein n=1 Tax=Rhodosorus marinus TaxID=101924 RepID=A0A7S2ZDU1_9RHOD|mmetsp:Transcript_15980/g.65721  ORF Transcript_15980/g.65721 Transcript_15980/m.65721 type:complete len:243 (+) Transcript_15980:380-1108(+)|eukprot:CAMPEP_0113961152 /NCGR_PEP_ID=MMETSP0011_2-20120614/5135_1 /TAXON_ID=101924 /ORGANISM="Rhodosorus marinus" /LENGTH=242 /DNA_ID=CAMNT_0000972731 /DNA_START=317 /DNA_END=1045 /DNA_ORIENTATION=- /assembly_acc=CAM_ASM_000156